MFLHHENKKKKKQKQLKIIIALLAVLFLVFFVYKLYVQDSYSEPVIKQDQEISQTKTLLSLASSFLGFTKPQTYLVLFLNNTELRPTGGFIGSYAVITLEKGKATIHQVDGSENTRWKSEDRILQQPPTPLRNYLGVPYWYFRDSNWSPDFAISAQKAIELYKQEVVNPEKNIDMVIGVTPVVLEALLDIVGKVTIDGITFTPENVIEKLEYEVEFGYAKRNISIHERKDILQPFFKTVLKKITPHVVSDLHGLIEKIAYLADTRNLQFYALDSTSQKQMQNLGWSGELATSDGDFLMWVDANLGALKTDHAMWRELDYRVVEKDGGIFAEVTMNYQHNGVYDWRTSRYRTYARVFTPQNSQLAEVLIEGKSVDMSEVDRGQEHGKQWFGTFISIEPGLSKKVIFRYKLPAQIEQLYKYNQYKLYVQKQAGTDDIGLTITHSFDKNIVSASPAESKEFWNDKLYTINTDLEIDREFLVELK